MSRSYRRYVFAAFGLILLLFGAPLYWANLRCEHYSPNRQHYADVGTSKPKRAPQNPSGVPVKSAVQRIADALDTLNQKPASEYEQRNTQAQEYLACWTPWVFSVALGEMLVTLFGVILVFATLNYTRHAVAFQKAATRAALRQVAEAKRQAKAAEDAIEVTRDIGKKQIRAYVSIDERNVTFGFARVHLSHFYICLPLKNRGATPAKDLSVSCNLRIFFQDKTAMDSKYWQNPLERSEFEIKTILGADQERDEVWGLGFPGLQKLTSDACFPIRGFADILFSYHDVFGELTKEYLRADFVLADPRTPAKAKILRLTYDPQGAGDCYPIGWVRG